MSDMRGLSAGPSSTAAPRSARWRFGVPEEVGVVVALVVLMAIIGISRPRFLNPLNLLTILGNTTFQGMLSLGMVFLLAIREIDLSVGWMFNFSAVFSATLMVAGFNPWLATLGGVAFGALLGLMNGALAVSLRLPSIIITLGTYSMFQGLSLVVNRGRAVVPSDEFEQLLYLHLGEGPWCRSRRRHHLRVARDNSAYRLAAHAIWLSRAGRRQQSRCRASGGHPDSIGPVANTRAHGRHQRTIRVDVHWISGGDRSK